MNTAIDEMLKRYDARTPEEKKNAVKEIMQEIVLCGLSRAGFFQHAAFYGGTALRIFYDMDRFSEDLDFSLMMPMEDFELAEYFPMLEKEVAAYGLHVKIEETGARLKPDGKYEERMMYRRPQAQTGEKRSPSEPTNHPAFIKGNSREYMLLFYADESVAGVFSPGENIKIKFEVDIEPPEGATFETRFRLLPAPYSIRLYDLPSLFAGKIHAVICRAWGNRVKGRDLYDYIFYLQRGAKVNLPHVQARLIDSGALDIDTEFRLDMLKAMLDERFRRIDYEQAKEDVRNFIRDQQSLEVWGEEFFCQITEGLEAEEINGKVVAKLTNPYQARVDIAESLFGVLPSAMTLEEAREEQLDDI